MPRRTLDDYSTDELLYELLKLTRRQQWEADPLRFGTEVFSQHFSKPPAPMHRLILRLVTGVEPPAPGRPVDQTAPGPGVRETGTGQPPGVRESRPTAPSVKGVGLPGAAAGVGECRPTVNTSLPFSPPASSEPTDLTNVHPMNTTGEG